MNHNAALLDTLIEQAESAAQRNGQFSRQTRQAIHRRLARTDSETVVRQLDEIYQMRASRLPNAWRKAQLNALPQNQ